MRPGGRRGLRGDTSPGYLTPTAAPASRPPGGVHVPSTPRFSRAVGARRATRARRRPPMNPSAQRPTNHPRTWCGPLGSGPVAAPTSRSGVGSGAPPAQRIRPARGTREAGAAGGAPAWPQFPLPARRLQRPLSDNGALSDLPLPRIPPLRPTARDAAPAQHTQGALTAAPPAPLGQEGDPAGPHRPADFPFRVSPTKQEGE
jgi:hypothetical protein